MRNPGHSSSTVRRPLPNSTSEATPATAGSPTATGMRNTPRFSRNGSAALAIAILSKLAARLPRCRAGVGFARPRPQLPVRRQALPPLDHTARQPPALTRHVPVDGRTVPAAEAPAGLGL